MIRILLMGDPHIRGTNPRNRLGDYFGDVKAKFREVYDLAKQYQVAAIVEPGDTFDSETVADGVKQDVADLFDESPVPIIATLGSHDFIGYNLATYRRTSLAAVERMTTKLKVVKDSDSYIRLGDLVALTFQPHTPRVDVDGFGYSPNAVVPPELFNLHTAHGMAIDHEPPFNTFTLLKDIQTTADLVFCGHYHPGWGIFNRADGKTFVNLGSLTRTAASQPEIQRDISVAILEVRSKTDYTITPIKLLCAKPGDQVLDRSRIEAENARAYAMGEFSALIKTQDGEVAQLDVNTIVETIAAQEKLPQEVVTAALDKINECKGAVA